LAENITESGRNPQPGAESGGCGNSGTSSFVASKNKTFNAQEGQARPSYDSRRASTKNPNTGSMHLTFEPSAKQ